MEDFQHLEKNRQEELLQDFDTYEQNLQSQKIIAVIRESVRRFKENAFLQLLAKKDRWVAEQQGQSDDKGPSKPDKAGKPDPGKIETKEKKPKYISKSNVPVNFGKSILKNEADVEAYVKAVKEAYLAEIKAGKRVQI